MRLAIVAAFVCLPLCGQDVLPDTAPLDWQGDLAARMVEGIHRHLDQRLPAVAAQRESYWRRDFASTTAYNQSVEPNRRRLARILGAVDPRVTPPRMEYVAAKGAPALLAEGRGIRVYSVRWQALDGVWGEGILLQPERPPVARVVALPDADDSPESVAGLSEGTAPFALRLAERGCEVLVPLLMDRDDTLSGAPGIRLTNQPHREFLYRMAAPLGRHIIGYEVQKVLAAADWFQAQGGAPVLVAGYGEGGLLALYSAALDTRIAAALVSGYFQPRESLWREPMYREVWGLLEQFGDADVASLISPRGLVVEASDLPRVEGPPPETAERRGAAPGGIASPPAQEVRAEVERARPYFNRLNEPDRLRWIESSLPGSDAALEALLHVAGARREKPRPAGLEIARKPDAAGRRLRQFRQMSEFTQKLVRESPRRRAEFWAKADASSHERWRESTQVYRETIWNDVIGRMPDPTLPPSPRSRLIFEQPKFRGYEVVLDVWPDVFAYGILLLPKDLKPGEKRPVVVCQHGLEGRPSDIADPKVDHKAYHQYGLRLAEEGFIVFAPQNPYIGEGRFRLIQRKARPLKLSLFSFVLGQHQRILEWLSGLPYVDADRIGFYGLSYGGYSALRIPPLLDGYALSICSGNFNEWVWKTTSIDMPYSYMFTREYDILEFDFANVFNHGELANLMAPRPFMVERGHADGVGDDEWVAYEFAKVRRFYTTKMKLPGHAAIEYFDGVHEIHSKETFEFLRRHLNWPKK